MTVDERFLVRKRKKARTIRLFRKIHRQTAVFLFVAFFIMAGTGLLLGWKKNSGGLLLAPTEKGTSSNMAEWLPLDSLTNLAVTFLNDSVSASLSPEIDRIDVRPDKGVVKFTFANHYKGLQIDGATGKILRVEQRVADLIEHMHDGTILDRIFRTGNGIFKLIYSTLTGLALMVFTITGVWLWLGPKRLHRMKQTGKQ
jgi:uncharacterized iron-regulated membrane protein